MVMNKSCFKKYLLWFANEHIDFKVHEIKSLVSLFKLDVKWEEEPKDEPFWIITADSECSLKKIASRSVTLRYVLELWGQATSLPLLHENIKALPSSLIEPFCAPDLSFKIKVETFNCSQTQQEKVDKIETFSYLPLKGQVKLKNPDIAFQYIEFFGVHPSSSKCPAQVFFGRQVASGQRDLISKLTLKKRAFIGNTSMDPQLSLLMANQAQITEGDLVLDPFVGTGSLLIAAAEFGGYVMGTDIDFLMLHGKSRPTRKQFREYPRKDESVLKNMEQYNLTDRYIDVVVADAALPLWRPGLILDAVITDPPYGIREAMERVGCSKQDRKIREEHLKTHIPSKIHYSMDQMISDLLCFSARHLKLGGKLVFWIPIIRSEYDKKNLPKHDFLELSSNSEQILSMTSSRRLLTYVKTKESQ